MKKLIILLNLILVYFLIDFSMAGFFLYITKSLQTVNVSPDGIEKKITDTKPKNFKKRKMYNSINNRNLFKTKHSEENNRKTEEPSGPIDLEQLDQTALELELLGTVTGKGSDSFAVIQNRSTDNQQMLYKKGDLVDNAVIKMILRKKVVLSVNGKDEILEMKEDEAKERTKIPKPHKSRSLIQEKPRTTRKGPVSRSDFSQMAENPEDWIRHLRIRPFFKNNKMEGFRINGIKDSSIFEKLGIQNGDVITSVGNRKIRSVKDIMEIYNRFTSNEKDETINIELKRNNQLKKLQYNIQ